MTPTVWLTLISVVAASALFIALAVFLVLILRELTPTGGTPTSFLGKIRLGLRAIEIETSNNIGEHSVQKNLLSRRCREFL